MSSMFAKEMMQFCDVHSIVDLGVVISTEITEQIKVKNKIRNLKMKNY